MRIFLILSTSFLLAAPAWAQLNELHLVNDRAYVVSSSSVDETNSLGLAYLRWASPEFAVGFTAEGIFPDAPVVVLPTADPLLAAGIFAEFLPIVAMAGGKIGAGASAYATSGASDNPVVLNFYLSMRRQVAGFAFGANAGWGTWLFDPNPDRDAIRLALQAGFVF